ncbi:MAG: hypothetical protein AB8B85_01535 [Paracoccaceae bacterium]
MMNVFLETQPLNGRVAFTAASWERGAVLTSPSDACGAGDCATTARNMRPNKTLSIQNAKLLGCHPDPLTGRFDTDKPEHCHPRPEEL